MENLSVTNQEVVDLSCNAERGIFLAGPAIVASLAGRELALAACATGEYAVVSWSWDAAGLASISVDKTSSPLVSACVQAAIVAQPADILGSCTAQVPLGLPAQAAR